MLRVMGILALALAAVACTTIDETKHPLGSRENPVKADMPNGQRAYLDRLRCADGHAPSYKRGGNFGDGPYGNIIDGYRVTCTDGDEAGMWVFMDMYFRGHVEMRPVPGFTIVSP